MIDGEQVEIAVSRKLIGRSEGTVEELTVRPRGEITILTSSVTRPVPPPPSPLECCRSNSTPALSPPDSPPPFRRHGLKLSLTLHLEQFHNSLKNSLDRHPFAADDLNSTKTAPSQVLHHNNAEPASRWSGRQLELLRQVRQSSRQVADDQVFVLDRRRAGDELEERVDLDVGLG